MAAVTDISIEAVPTYGPSTTKRTRRTREQLDDLRSGLVAIVRESQPTTVRFAYYRAAARQMVPKDISGYRTVQRLLGEMREDGTVPFDWLVDHTRWRLSPDTYADLASFLEQAASTYRRALWARSDVHLEVWCESDSVAGVLHGPCDEYDVPLMVVRGYSSKTFAYSCAQELRQIRRPAFLYYFGDHDEHGFKIERALRESLERYGAGAQFAFERVALTTEQVEMYDLQESIKKTSPKGYAGKTVEIEALPSDVIRELCRSVIESHVDQRQLEVLRAWEESERGTLAALAAGWWDR